MTPLTLAAPALRDPASIVASAIKGATAEKPSLPVVLRFDLFRTSDSFAKLPPSDSIRSTELHQRAKHDARPRCGCIDCNRTHPALNDRTRLRKADRGSA